MKLFDNIYDCRGALVPVSQAEKYDWCSILGLLNQGIRLLLWAAGFVAVLYIILGAYHYLTAFGNEEKAKRGKDTIFWAVIGIVVVVLAYVVIGEIWRVLVRQSSDTPPAPAPPSLESTSPSPTFGAVTVTPTATSGSTVTPVDKAKQLFQDKKSGGVSMSNGPCLGTVDGWAVDVVHNPRTSVDDLSANQCGVSSHFIELDVNGNLVQSVD